MFVESDSNSQSYFLKGSIPTPEGIGGSGSYYNYVFSFFDGSYVPIYDGLDFENGDNDINIPVLNVPVIFRIVHTYSDGSQNYYVDAVAFGFQGVEIHYLDTFKELSLFRLYFTDPTDSSSSSEFTFSVQKNGIYAYSGAPFPSVSTLDNALLIVSALVKVAYPLEFLNFPLLGLKSDNTGGTTDGFTVPSLNGNCGSLLDGSLVTVNGLAGDFSVVGSQFLWNDETDKQSTIIYKLSKNGTFCLVPDAYIAAKAS